MEGRSSVAFLADGAADNQVALTMLTNKTSAWRVGELVVCAVLLPLLDAARAEASLALATFFCLNDDHLANATDEVIVEFFRRHLRLIAISSSSICVGSIN